MPSIQHVRTTVHQHPKPGGTKESCKLLSRQLATEVLTVFPVQGGLATQASSQIQRLATARHPSSLQVSFKLSLRAPNCLWRALAGDQERVPVVKHSLKDNKSPKRRCNAIEGERDTALEQCPLLIPSQRRHSRGSSSRGVVRRQAKRAHFRSSWWTRPQVILSILGAERFLIQLISISHALLKSAAELSVPVLAFLKETWLNNASNHQTKNITVPSMLLESRIRHSCCLPGIHFRV